jgi:hypothetical protein
MYEDGFAILPDFDKNFPELVRLRKCEGEPVLTDSG